MPITRRHTIAAAGLALLAPVRAATCLLTPDATEGPFYFDPSLVRDDISEGRPGAPLSLRLMIAGLDCAPRAGARVDLWHCDAMGDYSGVSNYRSRNFLRGTQFADAAGIVAFRTIYPGWYPGRATHIHAKVFVAGRSVFTGQILFPDPVSDMVFASSAAYRPAGNRPRNDADGIARRLGDAAIAAVDDQGGNFSAALTLIV